MANRLKNVETYGQSQTDETTTVTDVWLGDARQAVDDTAGLSGGGLLNRRFTVVKAFLATTLLSWLTMIVFLGVRCAFITAPGSVPIPIAIGVVGPLIVFVVTFWMSSSFRNFLMAVDLPLITTVQSWRFAGFGFLALHAHGILPGVFAWPAGLGDIAIGLTAPWIAHALVRKPGFATTRLFVVWNLLGILDLLVAVGTAALSSSFATGSAGEITVAPMAQMPLVLIPVYLVPLFAMLHLTAMLQAWKLILGRSRGVGEKQLNNEEMQCRNTTLAVRDKKKA